MDQHSKETLEQFLKDFWGAWYSIKQPAKLLEKYFCIEEWGVVWLRLYWDNCLYLGAISDVSLDDVQNVANAIKVLVNNYLKNAQEDVWVMEAR